MINLFKKEAEKEAFRYYSNDDIWDYEIDGADYKHCTYISLWAFER